MELLVQLKHQIEIPFFSLVSHSSHEAIPFIFSYNMLCFASSHRSHALAQEAIALRLCR